MKKILIFKDKGLKDLFDSDDNVKNVMTPSSFSGKKLGLADKQAFLYKGYPMYLDRTVIHARKEDIPHVQELFKESVEYLNEAKLSNDELTKEVHKIKQHMINKGIVRPDDQVKHLHKDDQDAVIHGIVHGTNTLGFKNHLKTRKITETVEHLDEISKETLKSYKDYASLDAQLKKNAMNKRRLEGKSDEELALKNKRNSRMDYIQKAIKKLTKESVELNEDKRISRPIGNGYHIIHKSDGNSYDGPFDTLDKAKKFFKDEKLNTNKHEIVHNDGKSLTHFKESTSLLNRINILLKRK